MSNTKEKIMLSAVSLFVSKGVAETTTREIAARAQVAEGSIYRYFPSKEELAWQVFRDHHQYLAEHLQQAVMGVGSIQSKIEALVTCFLKLADEDWLLFRYYLTAQHTYMHKIDANSVTPYGIILGVIKDAVSNNEIKSKSPPVRAAMAMGSVHQIAINKIYSRIDGPLLMYEKEISNYVSRMLIAGTE